MTARAWHAAIAVLVLVALALQVWVAVQVSATPPSHATGLLAGTTLVGRLIRVVSFFTIQGNILSGIVSAQLAIRPERDGRLWRVLRLDALFGIAVTGIVYSTVLARIHEPHGWKETAANTIVHYLVPIGMVLGWLLFGPRPRITARVVAWSLLWPVLWLGYTLLRGALWHWYPYPFVDVAAHGYGTVLINAVLVTLVFAVIAALFLVADRRLPSTHSVHRSR